MGENREDEKQREENRVENGIFHCLIQERKQERQKIGRKIIPLDSHFFYPLNLGGKWEGKSAE